MKKRKKRNPTKRRPRNLVIPNSIHEFGPFLKAQRLLGVAVEVGVAEGRTTAELISFGFKQVHAVDRWEHLPDQPGDGSMPQSWHDVNRRQVEVLAAGHAPKIILVQMDSVEAAAEFKDKSIDFVYLDANHTYQAVLADLKAWTPKIKPGGIMAGHDYNHLYGVQRAVDEFAGGVVHVLPEQAIENQGFFFYVNDLK